MEIRSCSFAEWSSYEAKSKARKFVFNIKFVLNIMEHLFLL